jgi:type IX secretion system PorP/SprF family membrane protein
MKKLWFSIALLVCFTSGYSQVPGPFLRQFNANGYIFNPAYVAINDQPEANIFYRKQWINFKDAPETTGFSLQYPTNGRVVLGMNFVSDTQVLLKNTTITGTFGYVLPISNNESIRFALSWGYGMNKLNLTAEELNTNDPAIVNAADNNSYMDGNFGIVYTYGGLRLGFALTEIFESDPFNAESFNEFKLTNLHNRLYSASYRFNVGVREEFALEPYALYRQSQDGLQNYWEIATMAYYKDRIWGGVSYNQNKGLGLMLGLNVMDKFRFAYSYEFPPFDMEMSGANSHELHLGFRFGDKRSRPVIARNNSYKRTVAQNRRGIRQKMREDQKAAERVAMADEPVEVETRQEPVQVAEYSHPLTQTESAPVTVEEALGRTGTPPRTEVLEEGFYVVVGAFSVKAYAYRFAREIKAKGYTTTTALNPGKNLYYVYIFSSYNLEEAQKVRNEYKARNLFSDAWVFMMPGE